MFVIHYADLNAPMVAEVEAAEVEIFVEGLPEVEAAFTKIEDVPTAALVALYNRANPAKPVKKFENRRLAVERTSAFLRQLAVQDASKAAIAEAPEKAPTPAPSRGKAPTEKKGSPAKGKKLGVGARMAALIREEKSTDEILETIRREFPDSRAGRSDVSIVRGKVNKGIM